MSALTSGAPVAGPRRGGASAAGHVILVRLAAEGGATRAELARDLAPLFTHKLAPADWRRMAERETAGLLSAGLATETRNRLTLTDAGAAVAARYLGRTALEPSSWAELRDLALIAKALGLETEAQRLKTLTRVEGLGMVIVQKAFGLPVKRNVSPAKLRAELAVVALERAFGNRVKAGFGKGSALSAKAGRLLAGQLSKTPRAFPTDAKLIAELAAENAGARTATLDGLRAGLLRGLGARVLEAAADEAASEASRPAVLPARVTAPPAALKPAANDPEPAASPPPRAARPDLAEFARAVKEAASARAEGWPGSRKAFISHVWDAIRTDRSSWQVSEIEFKCMLAEAHRAGAVVLANADLKDRRSLKDLESSAVPYKNTVWHFVRVEE